MIKRLTGGTGCYEAMHSQSIVQKGAPRKPNSGTEEAAVVSERRKWVVAHVSKRVAGAAFRANRVPSAAAHKLP